MLACFVCSLYTSVNTASMAEVASGGGSEPSGESFKTFTEVSPGFLTNEIKEGLHFSLVVITEHNKDSWLAFTNKVRDFFSRYESDSLTEVPACFRLAVMGADVIERGVFDKGLTQADSGKYVWMAVLSHTPLTLADDLMLTEDDYTNVEMAITASSALNVPFSVHMGIFRNTLSQYKRAEDGGVVKLDDAPESHSRISVLLHSTTAQAVAQFRREKGAVDLAYMITSPVRQMARILEKSLPEKSMGHAYNEYSESVDYASSRDVKYTGEYKYTPSSYLWKRYEHIDGKLEFNKDSYARTTPITIWRTGETWTKFALLDEDKSAIFESEAGDENWWLYEIARKHDPFVTVPYKFLMEAGV